MYTSRYLLLPYLFPYPPVPALYPRYCIFLLPYCHTPTYNVLLLYTVLLLYRFVFSCIYVYTLLECLLTYCIFIRQAPRNPIPSPISTHITPHVHISQYYFRTPIPPAALYTVFCTLHFNFSPFILLTYCHIL